MLRVLLFRANYIFLNIERYEIIAYKTECLFKELLKFIGIKSFEQTNHPDLESFYSSISNGISQKALCYILLYSRGYILLYEVVGFGLKPIISRAHPHHDLKVVAIQEGVGVSLFFAFKIHNPKFKIFEVGVGLTVDFFAFLNSLFLYNSNYS